jgi:hypothetical protein
VIIVYYICEINLQEETEKSDNVQDIYFFRSAGNLMWCGYETLAWQFTNLLRTLCSTSFKRRLITGVLTHQHHVLITEVEEGMKIKQAVSYRGKTAMSQQSHFIRTASWSTTLLLTQILIHDRSNMQNMKHHNSKKRELISATVILNTFMCSMKH